jgi:redox-sensitive bicupin YhaK (pirin superfamily)
MENRAIIKIKPLGFPWETSDPFLFCVHHLDNFPAGNENMGPATSLEGRNIGNDFIIKDGWRMYHGDTIPGFPVHPHRGFETVTVVLNGFVDHADSLGAAGRYGNGDVQWMTAGKGIQHCEMFPLLNKDKENPLELFQIWLNLPKNKKFVVPYFDMLWNNTIPKFVAKDALGKSTEVIIVAGKINNLTAPPPAPDSWAANPENEIAIWRIKLDADAQWQLPEASQQANRTLYFFKGSNLKVAGKDISPYHSIELYANEETILENGNEESHLLLLQGKPIDEPVVQYGPFVMNTRGEIRQAYSDYQKTQFGGWPWDRPDQVHPRTKGRFARHANGREEIK